MIVQVGPYPEPFGGISVYIQRMKQYMDMMGIPNEVWDTSGVKKQDRNVHLIRLKTMPLKILLRKDIQLVHYNICGDKSKKFIGFFNNTIFKNRKKLLTIHGDCRILLKDDSIGLIRALNSFDAIICVKKGDEYLLRNHGVKSRIYEVPAFIPPCNAMLSKRDGRMPEAVEKFIKRHEFIISSNASSINFHNGEDLYGINLCIKLMKKIKESMPCKRAGLVFCLSNVNEKNYFEKMVNMIKEYHLESDFLFVTEKIELFKVIKKSQLFVRPTNTDGFSVSLAEALFFHVPSLVSDAVPRPAGSILFKTGDLEDFFKKAYDIIERYDCYKESAKKSKQNDNAIEILEIYKDLIGQVSCQSSESVQ